MLSKSIKLGLALIVTAIFVTGCASSSDTSSTPPQSTEPTVVSEPTTTTPVESTVTLGTIFYFDFDQATLSPETRALLTSHADRLKSSPRSIRLEGHADERGTREYNMALGERRAIAVRDFLLLQGVTSPVEVISYGEERPADSGSTESAWSLNRRVELK